MSRFNKNIPEGTRDVLYGEAELLTDIGERLDSLFKNEGFSRVITPLVEYYDTFNHEGQSLPQESMYKLTDSSGRLIVLRADNTTPIARVAATKLKGERVKLFYRQNVFRVNNDYSGKRNETTESGVEFIGYGGEDSDFECIKTALSAMSAIKDGMKFVIEIGHAGFCNALISRLGLDEEKSAAVRKYINTKNSVSLGFIGDVAGMDAIRELPSLYGGEEVLSRAAEIAGDNEEATACLDGLKRIYERLNAAGYGENIMFDLGIVHSLDYYTGIVFRGYLVGAGEPVLLGGRYDNLGRCFDNDLPSVGFAINLCLAADAVQRKEASL